MKKLLSFALACLMILSCVALASCGKKPAEVKLSATQEIIKQAQTMTLEELAKKAIEESNGKTFYGVGNSSRGKSALPLFIEYLQSIDSSYKMEFEWQQPKNNKIFDQLTADSKKAVGTFAMTLIQDGNQIESKMVQTGVLDTFIPKDWADANGVKAEDYKGYLALQTLNKVFMFNSTGDKTYTNVWDFVAEGEHGLYMDIDSELVGKNFLYMLTKDEYAADLKAAYDALSADKKAYIDKAIADVEADAKAFGLGENGKYALAWIKLWVGSYNAQTDDGPICNTLVDASATDQFGLLVYSKLRSVTESESISKNNVKVAAYEDGYTGFGGYGYCHYLFVTENSPLPWTACAFIAYMTCTVDGFSAWGKDIGGYSSNPTVAAGTEEKYHHSTGAKLAVQDGAENVDIVMHVGEFLAGDYETVCDEIWEQKAACGEVPMKVILETGDLLNLSNVKKASILSMYAGADYIKTSTGKEKVGATPEAVYVMCQAIKEYYDKTGIMIGLKPAGGINSVKDALTYYSIVEEILGEKWLTNYYFRLGTSRLPNLILSDLAGKEVKFF